MDKWRILSLQKPSKRRGPKPRDGPVGKRVSLEQSIVILWGPNALARMARVQREMDVIHAAGQKKMLANAIRNMFK